MLPKRAMNKIWKLEKSILFSTTNMASMAEPARSKG